MFGSTDLMTAAPHVPLPEPMMMGAPPDVAALAPPLASSTPTPTTTAPTACLRVRYQVQFSLDGAPQHTLAALSQFQAPLPTPWIAWAQADQGQRLQRSAAAGKSFGAAQVEAVRTVLAQCEAEEVAGRSARRKGRATKRRAPARRTSARARKSKRVSFHDEASQASSDEYRDVDNPLLLDDDDGDDGRADDDDDDDEIMPTNRRLSARQQAIHAHEQGIPVETTHQPLFSLSYGKKRSEAARKRSAADRRRRAEIASEEEKQMVLAKLGQSTKRVSRVQLALEQEEEARAAHQLANTLESRAHRSVCWVGRTAETGPYVNLLHLPKGAPVPWSKA